jgi:hypothetical protein
MPKNWTLTLTDSRGREKTRTVNTTIDIRDFKDKAGFAYLVIAANPHLSVRQLVYLLKQHGIIRSREWVRKNRVAG